MQSLARALVAVFGAAAQGVVVDGAGRPRLAGYFSDFNSPGLAGALGLTSQGALDPSFGSGGLPALVAGTDDQSRAIALVGNAGFAVAGVSAPADAGASGSKSVTVWRYAVDGTPVTSFGNANGAYLTPRSTAGARRASRTPGPRGTAARANDLWTGPCPLRSTPSSGSSSAASGTIPEPQSAAVWRLAPDGTLDPTFGMGGVFTIYGTGGGGAPNAVGESAYAVAIDSSHRPVVVGASAHGSWPGNPWYMAVWRLTP
jgi:hypothetical protein